MSKTKFKKRPYSFKTDEYKWGTNITDSLVREKAPKGAVCAIVYGSVYGWEKGIKVGYFSVDIDMDTYPAFPSEPVNEYSVYKRKKVTI